MSEDAEFDEYLMHTDGFTRIHWQLASDVFGRLGEDERRHAWNSILRRWTVLLSEELGPEYGAAETKGFFVVAPRFEGCLDRLSAYVERCRRELLANVPANASLDAPGKQVVIAIGDRSWYYGYLGHFGVDGEQGSSAGVHVRAGYPHVVARGYVFHEFETTIAHELTHAALHSLGMPAWLEEGLTQRSEIVIAGRAPLHVDQDVADEHKAFWQEEGLEEFWRGESFHRGDFGRMLSYQLSEILLKLLFEDFRPRWFGFDQEPRKKLIAFLGAAKESDCGREAARIHLGRTLGSVAGTFLGPGDWEPKL